jgi:transposase
MDMQNATLITLCWELYEQGIPKTRIANRLAKHRETIHLWIKGIERHGLLGFLEKYEQAKKGERRSRRVDPIVKRLVWGLREREFHC